MSETTGGTGSMIQCGYRGNWHTYSYEMCKDMHNRPVAPATGGVAIGTFTMEYVNKLKADHLAALEERDKLIEGWQKRSFEFEEENAILTARNKELEGAVKITAAIKDTDDLSGIYRAVKAAHAALKEVGDKE
jgi:hypothetical protein